MKYESFCLLFSLCSVTTLTIEFFLSGAFRPRRSAEKSEKLIIDVVKTGESRRDCTNMGFLTKPCFDEQKNIIIRRKYDHMTYVKTKSQVAVEV